MPMMGVPRGPYQKKTGGESSLKSIVNQLKSSMKMKTPKMPQVKVKAPKLPKG